MIWIIDYLPDRMVRPVIDTHKSFGITVLGLAVIRVLLAGDPSGTSLAPSYSAWERWSARAAHWVLYALYLLPAALHTAGRTIRLGRKRQRIRMYLYGLVLWLP